MVNHPELESTQNRVATACTHVEVETNQLRQQVATLEQENQALWTDLKACQRSPSSQAQVAELERAYAVLQAEVRERYHSGQVLQGEAIIAREQERAAQERAAELAKANEALRRGVERLAEAGNINALLGSFLLEAITVTEASAGAVMDRVSGSEFQMRSLAESGVIEKTFDAHAPEAVFSEVTTRDPAGVFRQLAAGTGVLSRSRRLLCIVVSRVSSLPSAARTSSHLEFPIPSWKRDCWLSRDRLSREAIAESNHD